MITQSVKNTYYLFLYPLSYISSFFYKLIYKKRFSDIKKIHVGCGENYLEGFINIDGNFNRRVDFLLDVRVGLPFPDDAIEFIYSCHMLEHLMIEEAEKVLKEFYRVLSPSGRVRLALPDFEHVFQIIEGEKESRFPRDFKSKKAQAINYLFCDSQHKYAYCFELVEDLAAQIGFKNISRLEINKDSMLETSNMNEPEDSLVVELKK